LAVVDVKMVFLLVLATYGERGAYCIQLQSDSVWLDAITSHFIPFNFVTYCLVKSDNYEAVCFEVLKNRDLWHYFSILF
jgi:hypothetical protein